MNTHLMHLPAPGTLDLCFITENTLDEVILQLKNQNITNKNLIEIAEYQK